MAAPVTPTAADGVQRFPIRLQKPTLLRIFGVRPGERAMVTLDGEALEARFGIAHVRVPLTNITTWDISGPWNPITALGIRRSVRGGDLTFGGSAHGGVQVHFKDRPKILVFRPPSLYLTVDDLEGLGAALTARGIPGEDLRGR